MIQMDSSQISEDPVQNIRNLWAEVLNHALDLAKTQPHTLAGSQSLKFIQNRTGSFKLACKILDLDPPKTSQALMRNI